MSQSYLFQTPLIIPDEALSSEYTMIFSQLNTKFSLVEKMSKNIELNTEILINTPSTESLVILETQQKIKTLKELKGILLELLKLSSSI